MEGAKSGRVVGRRPPGSVTRAGRAPGAAPCTTRKRPAHASREDGAGGGTAAGHELAVSMSRAAAARFVVPRCQSRGHIKNASPDVDASRLDGHAAKRARAAPGAAARSGQRRRPQARSVAFAASTSFRSTAAGSVCAARPRSGPRGPRRRLAASAKTRRDDGDVRPLCEAGGTVPVRVLVRRARAVDIDIDGFGLAATGRGDGRLDVRRRAVHACEVRLPRGGFARPTYVRLDARKLIGEDRSPGLLRAPLGPTFAPATRFGSTAPRSSTNPSPLPCQADPRRGRRTLRSRRVAPRGMPQVAPRGDASAAAGLTVRAPRSAKQSRPLRRPGPDLRRLGRPASPRSQPRPKRRATSVTDWKNVRYGGSRHRPRRG